MHAHTHTRTNSRTMGHRYNHILAMGLQDKRKQLDGPREDPRKLQTQEQVHVDTCNHTTSQQLQ